MQPSARSFRVPLALVAIAAGLASPVPGAKPKPQTAPPPALHAEDLFIIDCLLPAPMRQLGRYATTSGARRAVRTTAQDCRIRGGEYAKDRADYAFAFQVWLEQARAGDAEAENAVGEILEKGVAGTPDPAGAAVWYRKSAARGMRRAQVNLGHLLEVGLGVARDPVEALSWYRRAAGLAELPAEPRVEEARREAAKLQAEVETLRRELAAARAELERARAAAPPAEKEKPGDAGDRREERVKTLADRLAGYEQRLAGLDRPAAESGAALATAALGDDRPTIQWVQPEILATRGTAVVPVAPGGERLELIGRVTAPAGLAELRAGERAIAVDEHGFFHLPIAVEGRTELRFVAIDRRQARGESSLLLLPAGDAAPPPAPAIAPPSAVESAAAARRRYHALILADGRYASLPELASVARDAEALATLLGDGYGFEVRTLTDPSYLETLRALDDLRRGLGENDDLLIYFAGHGRLSSDGQRGFWLPSDAGADENDNWIPTDLVADFLSTLGARHVLVVADSCYAGTLTRGSLSATGAETAIAASAAARSRTALASGGLQPVLDSGGGGHSIFARAMLTVLTLNRQPLSGAELHREVAARVAFLAAGLGLEQSPSYAPIRFAGHEAGDFVFLPRARGAGAQGAAAANSARNPGAKRETSGESRGSSRRAAPASRRASASSGSAAPTAVRAREKSAAARSSRARAAVRGEVALQDPEAIASEASR